jgi:hypothetical protein
MAKIKKQPPSHCHSRNNLLWYSVSEKEFEDARPFKTPLSRAELWRRIKEADPAPEKLKSKTVFGIELKNQSAFQIGILEALLKHRVRTKTSVMNLLKAFTDWRKPKRTHEQNFFKSKHSTFQQVLEDSKIFPGETGLQLAYLQAQFNINASPYTHYGMDFWKEADLHLIIEALHSFPLRFFNNLHPPQNILRFERGAGPRGVVNGDSGIWIYDPWETQTPASKIISFVHELSHVVANRLKKKQLVQWNEIGGWKLDPKTKEFKLAKPTKAVSMYGKNSPDEDLAESMVAYRFYPWFMRNHSPKKYEFLKSAIFGGEEYITPDMLGRVTVKNA